MTLTATFGGGSLPTGWSFEQNGAGNATIDNSGDCAEITIPAGTTSDSIYSSNSPDNTAGLIHAVSGDFDVAVRYSTIIGGDNSGMLGFGLRGPSDSEYVRYTFYAQTAMTNHYGYARSNNPSYFNNFRTATGLPVSLYLNGHPMWIRAKKVGSDFTFLGSADGLNWDELASVNAPVVPEIVKLVAGQIGSKLGLPTRIDECVDMTGMNDDVRGPIPTVDVGTLESTDFTTLPTWTTLSSAPDGDAVHSTGKVSLSTAPLDGSKGVLSYDGVGYARNAGLLVAFEVPTPDLSAYLSIGLFLDDGLGSVDVNTDHPNYKLDIGIGSSISGKFSEVHRPVSVTTYQEPYVYLGGDAFPEGNQLSTRFVRLERIGKWLRGKLWSSVTPGGEPAVWDWEGVTDGLRGLGPLKPYVSLTHAPSAEPTATVDILSLDFYELVSSTPETPGGISIGEAGVSSIFVGSTPVQRVYRGSDVLFDSTP